MKQEPAVFEMKSSGKEPLECEQLRVEADSWFSLGKCFLNAFIKLYYPFLLSSHSEARNILFVPL